MVAWRSIEKASRNGMYQLSKYVVGGTENNVGGRDGQLRQQLAER